MGRAPFQLRAALDGEQVRLTVDGELDVHNAARLTEATRGILGTGVHELVLDLAGVGFCDSSGLSALVRIKVASDAAGCALALAGLGPRLRWMLDVSGLDEYLGISPAGGGLSRSSSG